MIASQELAKGLEKMLNDSSNHDEVFSVFVSFLEENNLLTQLPQIIRRLEHNSQIQKTFNTFVIESPFKLGNEVIATIKESADAKDAEHSLVENKELLGGFRATYQGRVVDGSLKHNLQVLKKQLTN
jgi:F0F1-type ATP synthase delta subunit